MTTTAAVPPVPPPPPMPPSLFGSSSAAGPPPGEPPSRPAGQPATPLTPPPSSLLLHLLLCPRRALPVLVMSDLLAVRPPTDAVKGGLGLQGEHAARRCGAAADPIGRYVRPNSGAVRLTPRPPSGSVSRPRCLPVENNSPTEMVGSLVGGARVAQADRRRRIRDLASGPCRMQSSGGCSTPGPACRRVRRSSFLLAILVS
jgi:hypothetical protein